MTFLHIVGASSSESSPKKVSKKLLCLRDLLYEANAALDPGALEFASEQERCLLRIEAFCKPAVEYLTHMRKSEKVLSKSQIEGCSVNNLHNWLKHELSKHKALL